MDNPGVTIICNGKEKGIAPGTTLVQLLHGLNLKPDTVVVECDGKIINRDEYETHVLIENSRLELIRFVGGG